MSQRTTLEPGNRFPELTATSVSGDGVTIPDDVGGDAVVLLFYRGHW